MPVTTAEPIGRELLFQHAGLAEDEQRKSCLVCRHFQARERLEIVICTKRPLIQNVVSGWAPVEHQRCVKRAQNCGLFEDMRPRRDHA